ncbi:hypothetical protein [Methylobacterium sp. 275MFSha3.1]|uniref:hypothetical protein n=1 Tax=Methylobacterium sp. 275MFSha3.1 TaxID=1502746 RepID=UPI000B83032C|nr:hypothetical protein [Methylobacterium sp. 275MFSha3.1]
MAYRSAWLQNFHVAEPSAGGSEAKDIPPALAMIASPHDRDVHYARKRATTGIGNKVCLTETCGDVWPPLIVDVATAPAPVVDRAVPTSLHAALTLEDLPPACGSSMLAIFYADGLVAAARNQAVAAVEPVPKDNKWQARTPGALSKPSTSTGIGRPRPRTEQSRILG